MNRKIAVVGLGYVGLPVAVAFGKNQNVIGFDINDYRIDELKNGYDRTNEVEKEDLKNSSIHFTSDKCELRKADFIIVAVPTPINKNNQPDLTPLLGASKTVGSALTKDTIVVYESTVYPGATEEDCVPVLEGASGLKCGEDFFVGYSPERINPGDKKHTFETITKVVSGQTPEVLEIVAEVYGSVVKAGVYKATSIKVAEAAKVIENTQRDVNIALMNELSVIFDKVGIDTKDVLEAAGTKWNFLKFSPGLVGGHCIGVDPYYLTHKAEELGHHPEVILAGRRINDNMTNHISSSIIKEMLKKGISVVGNTINVLGLTFKENCPDLRNTKVIDVIEELKEFGLNVVVHDAEADAVEAKKYYNIDLKKKSELPNADVVVYAVPHNEYKQNKKDYLKLLNDSGIIFDIKGMIDNKDVKEKQSIWRL
ncbi:nucleotide sugar dehydrogenase [Salinicoccus roseus]|uniref:nucleotide sugar dehydrogenase n=1 Tax=Salinicoccus roseus TaxID=45670 RepID=UPI002300289B|nr:nucleotide sugar dehydrogenase [Salinicoccus roseus]